VPLLDDVANTNAWAAQFDISAKGTLIYTVGNNVTQAWPIVWLDAAGNLKPLLSKQQNYDAPRLSPEGQRLAMEVVTSKGRDVYLYDIQRDNLARLTTSGATSPIWAPDGKHLAYSSGTAMWWLRADGATAPQKLLDDPKQSNIVAYSFSPDGKRLAYFAANAESGNDLWTVSLDLSDPDRPKTGRPEPFLNTRFNELEPVFSPDGRWLTYRSNESGRFEVYVRPSDRSKLGKWQISDGEVRHPRWSPAGGQLFWETPDSYIMVADYSVKGDSFIAGKPRRWSPVQVLAPSGEYNMDLSADGRQIVVFPRQEPKESLGSVHVTFLLNFFDELRRKVPVK
jgi:Tol biopolymer transport system component